MRRRQRSETELVGKEKEDLKSEGRSQNSQVESENAPHSDLSRSSTSDCLHPGSQALLPENLYLNQSQKLCLKFGMSLWAVVGGGSLLILFILF